MPRYGRMERLNLHRIIESDNLIALETLMPEYEGKIDVMPIDPPYNTAVSYIGYQDSGYENGWGAFMRPRLELAYRLLSGTGVMFIHIDENEFFALWSLCSEIFGTENLMTMIWKKTNEHFDRNRKEKPLESGIRRTHEFIVTCFKDKAHTILHPIYQPVWSGSGYMGVVKPLETVIDGMGTNASAKDELEELLGDRTLFATPKPVRLIEELIRAASTKDSVVLDFFAGSGTTGHATMKLNAKDGGHRRFILVTNNESNICRRVTIPRILKAKAICQCKDEIQVETFMELSVI